MKCSLFTFWLYVCILGAKLSSPQSGRNQAEFGGNSAGGRLVVFYISTEPGL